jgi:hypothetical protein
MTQVGIMLRLTLPPGMSAEQACREVGSSVEFGAAEIQLMYVLEDPPGHEADPVG